MTILVITSKATSANFRVSVDFALSIDKNATLYVICTSEDDGFIQNDNINIIKVLDPRQRFISYLNKAKEKGSLFARFLYRLYTYDFIPFIDSIRCSPIENKIEKAAKNIIKNNKFDYLISTNNPYFANKVSQRIKRQTSLPLIHIWLDPFNLRVIKGILGKYALRVERSFFEHSDYIFTLPEALSNDGIALEYSNKIISFELPFVFDRKTECSNYDILFAGSFSSVRNPHPALSFIVKCLPFLDEKYVFYFYCNISESLKQYETESGGRVHICNYLSNKELDKRLSSCYMLVNIGNSNSNQMPSKIVDYISFRKPIISFQETEIDPCSRYLDLYPDVFVVNTIHNTDSYLSEFVNFIQKEHTLISYNELMRVPLYKESSRSYLSEKLNSLIK